MMGDTMPSRYVAHRFEPVATRATEPAADEFRKRALATLASTNGQCADNGFTMAGMPPDSASLGRQCMHAALTASLLLPLAGAAQAPTPHPRSTSSSFAVMLTIRPAFRILESRPVPGGHEYRVWTNLKNARLNGRDYRFDRVGETTLVVPGSLIEPPLKPGP